MKRFEFSLETVRRWRLERAGIEELKLRQILAEKQKLAVTKVQIQSEMTQTARQLLGQRSMHSFELESLDSYRLHVRDRVRKIENQERQCEARIVEQRNRVLEARRQFELLERLRQKALAEWQAAGNKEQEEMAAELFLAKTIRDRNRGSNVGSAEPLGEL
jgi:non-homologous end joining protein Ku